MGKNKDFKKRKYYAGERKPVGKGKHNFKTMSFGSLGVLCTCDKRHQKFCGMEARALLQERFEQRYGVFSPSATEAEHEEEKTEGSSSLSDILQKEIAEAQASEAGTSSHQRLWEFTDTGVSGVEFLELNPLAVPMMNGEPLADFITSIFSSSSPLFTRHIRRMVPLQVVFHASPGGLKNAVQQIARNLVQDVVIEKRNPFVFKLEVWLTVTWSFCNISYIPGISLIYPFFFIFIFLLIFIFIFSLDSPGLSLYRTL